MTCNIRLSAVILELILLIIWLGFSSGTAFAAPINDNEMITSYSASQDEAEARKAIAEAERRTAGAAPALHFPPLAWGPSRVPSLMVASFMSCQGNLPNRYFIARKAKSPRSISWSLKNSLTGPAECPLVVVVVDHALAVTGSCCHGDET
jgi:hypothetical protein